MSEILLLKELQASEYLNVSRGFLRTCRSKGTGPKYVRIGRAIRYRLEDLQEYVHKNISG